MGRTRLTQKISQQKKEKMMHYNDTSYAAILLGNRLPHRLNKS
jgi:hypothetical protein